MGCCRRRGAADGRGDGWAERDCIFPSGGVPAWNVCCSSSLRARGGQVIPLQFPPLAGQRGGGCCCFVQARGCCVHSLQLTPTHGERKGGGKNKKQGTDRWWFVARGFALLGVGAALRHIGSCLFCVPDAKAVVPHRCHEVWAVLSPPVGIRCRESHCRPQGRVWLCVCCSAQGWQALCSVMAMIHQ